MDASTSRDAVLLIEGDRTVAERVRGELRSRGLAAVEVRTLADARERIRSSTFSAILVDTLLPDGSGYALAADIRNRDPHAPVILITRGRRPDALIHVAESDGGIGFPTFDDLPALGRRVTDLLSDSPSPLTARVRCRDLEVDRLRRQASFRGTRLPLTPIEIRLLERLVVSGVDGASTEELLDSGWDGDPPRSSNAIAVHIGHLRWKLESAGAPHDIECVRGAGYALRCAAEGHDEM